MPADVLPRFAEAALRLLPLFLAAVFLNPFDAVDLRLLAFAPVRREEGAVLRVPDFAATAFLAGDVRPLERGDDVTIDFFGEVAVVPATRAPGVAPISVPPPGVAVAGPAS